jgi:hypothetical protein
MHPHKSGDRPTWFIAGNHEVVASPISVPCNALPVNSSNLQSYIVLLSVDTVRNFDWISSNHFIFGKTKICEVLPVHDEL